MEQIHNQKLYERIASKVIKLHELTEIWNMEIEKRKNEDQEGTGKYFADVLFHDLLVLGAANAGMNLTTATASSMPNVASSVVQGTAEVAGKIVDGTGELAGAVVDNTGEVAGGVFDFIADITFWNIKSLTLKIREQFAKAF